MTGVRTDRPITQLGPIAIERLFGAVLYVYRGGRVAVVPIEDARRPRYGRAES